MPVSLICSVCSKPFSVRPSRAATARYCDYACHQVGEGRKGGAVRGAQKRAASTGRSYRKRLGRHEHRVVMEEALGRPLRPGEVVHHIDGNHLNNAPENLRVMSPGDHLREHLPDMLKRRKELRGY
jgi:hypothetical protein